MKKITRRQQDFLRRFLEVYKQEDEALHYTAVAQHLGLSNVAVYEMLRLLEGRGLVKAQYYLPEGSRGPGRSTVLFLPTQKAAQVLHNSIGVTHDEHDWEKTREVFLKQVKAYKQTGYDNLLSNLLGRISERHTPQVFMMEIITAVIVSVSMLQENAHARNLLKRLQRIGLPGEISLSALAGIGSALSMVERANRQLANYLISESERYYTMLVQIGEDNRRRLCEFAREVAKIINA